jgi:hypothetical protein
MFKLYTRTIKTDYTKKVKSIKSPFDKAFSEIDKAMKSVENAAKEFNDEIEKEDSIECDDISVMIRDGRIEIKGKDIKQIIVNGVKLY